MKIYRETNGSCAAQLELPDDQPEIDNDQLTAASLHTMRDDILKLWRLMFVQPDKGGWSLCPDYDTIVHTNCCRLVSPCGFIVILFMSNCHYLHFYVCVCEDFLFKHLTIIDNRSAWSHPLSAVDYSAQGCKDNPRCAHTAENTKGRQDYVSIVPGFWP